MDGVISFVALWALVLLTYCLWRWLLKKDSGRYFCSPPITSILGHILHVGSNPAVTFMKLAKTYGSVFAVRCLGIEILVLNDRESISQCFARMEFSGRARIPMMELLSKKFGLGFVMTHGSEALQRRKFFVKLLHDFDLSKSRREDLFQKEIDLMLQKMDEKKSKPFNLAYFFHPYSLNNIWRVIATDRFDDAEALRLGKHLTTVFTTDTFLSKLALFFPNLVNLVSPEKECRIEALNHITKAISTVVDRRASEHRLHGNENPKDVLDHCLKMVSKTEDPSSMFHPSQNFIVPALRDILAGSIDAVAITVELFITYMILNPECCAQLQEEIDTIVGRTQRPTLGLRSKMPFTEACIIETLRITSILPFSIPHSAITDCEFRGKVVKRNTIVLPNLYAVHHNPDDWAEPDMFWPQRFIKDGVLVDGAWKLIMPLSVGKRACLGKNIAEDELFLFITSLYQKFNFEAHGPLSTEQKFGLVREPVRHATIIAVPR